MKPLKSFVCGEWFEPREVVEDQNESKVLYNAYNAEPVAAVSSTGIDFEQVRLYSQKTGGVNLRQESFHGRARRLKALANYLMSRKDELYALSFKTGATKQDSWIDIEGGIGTLYAYSSKGRRELPDQKFCLEGNLEPLSKDGSFVGHHICTPKEGVALHINAFNFPCWGLLEKFAPTFLAGMPTIVKPASVSAFLAHKLVELMIESKLLPDGAIQAVFGSIGDLMNYLDVQDVVTFTGSASTGQMLRGHASIIKNSIPFNMEADSLNSSVLGLDAEPGSMEFSLFVKEVAREVCVKAGQKCTAIRRIVVPDKYVTELVEALREQFSKWPVGDPTNDQVRMGSLASQSQLEEVKKGLAILNSELEICIGGVDNNPELLAGDAARGAYFAPAILLAKDSLKVTAPHTHEVFGPVSSILPYKSTGEAIEIVARGKGSLVASVFSNDKKVCQELAYGLAPLHGRLLFVNEKVAKTSTGHGSPLPNLVHGGPGRAGGGEELGGIRAVKHYMQRTAIQGDPSILSAVSDQWLRGAERKKTAKHPFTKLFEELEIGECFESEYVKLDEMEVKAFAELSGDRFYAHMNDAEAQKGIFDRRVAHGYLVISRAAGLFVEPNFGPVLANYGLENLRFIEPVYLGDQIKVFLTCAQKVFKEQRETDKFPTGVVYWDVEVINQNNLPVALYQILTLVRRG